jgi:oxygen-independent coproporphyrinogen III oxidase
VIEHLYLHIPFCHRICPYCAFYKHTPGETEMDSFVQAMLTEADLWKAKLDIQPRTVFLGGGTPTALSTEHLRRLLSGLRDRFPQPWAEFCLEANPMTITANKAKMLTEIGVSRISLGVQAWDPATLTTLGRDHSAAQAETSYHQLRDAGIPSVNIDLMFSVPGQNLATWAATLDHTLSLQPDHVSSYNLNYEEDTAFFEKLKRGVYQEEPERDAAFFYHALDTLEAAGYRHYEISNYARPQQESQHNAAYWFGRDYLGLGPSAVSTIGMHRWKNMPDTQGYIRAITEGILPQQEAESLTTEQYAMERIALELRTRQGVSLDRLSHVTQRSYDQLLEGDLITLTPSHLQLSRRGKVLADAVAGELIG